DTSMLWLTAPTPTTTLSTPALLQMAWVQPNVTVVTNLDGSIQQVNAPQGMINVHSNSPYEYRLECFYATNVTGTNAPYGTNGPAFATYTIQNPDGITNYNRLWITEHKSSGDYLYQYTYIATNLEWDLLEPDGQTTVATWWEPTTNIYVTNFYRRVAVGT